MSATILMTPGRATEDGRGAVSRTRLASIWLWALCATLALALVACETATDPGRDAGPNPDGGTPYIRGEEDPPQPDTIRPDEPDPDDPDPDEPDPDDPVPDDPATPVVVERAFERAVVTANGRYLLAQVPVADRGLCLTVADLDDGSVRRPADLCNLRWIGVAPASAGGASVAYLLGATGDRVTVLELDRLQETAQLATEDRYTVLEVGPDGETVVLSNMPTDEWSESQYEWNILDMDMRHLAALRVAAGTVHEQTFPFAVRDVAFSPVDGAVLVALSWWKEDGLPEAQVHFMNPVSGAVEGQTNFPNCADELVVQPEGDVALLSPRQCFVHPIVLAPPPVEEEWPTPEDEWDEWDEWDMADPVSVIDLESREFVGNLPGFGPVAMAPDGQSAVAFSRRETLARQWNIFQRALVGLVVIRLDDLYWETLEYGDHEPDFFFTGDSRAVLLHHREDGAEAVNRLDADSLTLTALPGPPTDLDEHAHASTGDRVYTVFDGRLHRIASDAESVVDMPLDFVPTQVFTRPDGDLVLLEEDGLAVHRIDPRGEAKMTIPLVNGR